MTEEDRAIASIEMLDRWQRGQRRPLSYAQAKEIYEKTDTSELRARHGLETDSGSRWAFLRKQGMSDKLASFIIYKEKGII